MSKLQQVSEKALQELMHEIKDGIYAGQISLPSELEIAERLNVSRNIVRECLTSLEREGWVSRKHGIGTLVNKNIVYLNNRLDQTCGIKNSLEQNGEQVSVEVLDFRVMPAGANEAEKLDIKEGTSVLYIAQVFYGDEKPAVYCVDYIPERIILRKDYDENSFLPTFFDFLTDYCGGTTVETYLTEVRSLPVSDETAKALKVLPGTNLLYLGEVGYDFRMKPIMYAEEYYIDQVVNHMVVRKMM